MTSDDNQGIDLTGLQKAWDLWRTDPSIVKYGGLSDPSYLDEFHRMSCGLVVHFFTNAVRTHQDQDYADQLEELSLFFINSPARNALALERGAAKGIGVHLGLIRAIWSLLYRAFATGKLIQIWFDEPPPLQDDCSEEQALSDPIWRDWDEVEWENDRLRAHYDLFCKAVDFLVYHELAHHVRGHISYLKNEFGVAEIDEGLNFSPEDNSRRDAIRNIEYDADHTALDMMMMSLDQEIEFASWTEGQASREFFLLSVAIILLFQILDEAHSPMAEHYKRSHPAPVHRAMRLTSALSFTFAETFGWSDEEREEEHDLAWLAASDVAPLLSLPTGRWHGDDTEDMDYDHFAQEEIEFIAFGQMLNRLNAESAG